MDETSSARLAPSVSAATFSESSLMLLSSASAAPPVRAGPSAGALLHPVQNASPSFMTRTPPQYGQGCAASVAPASSILAASSAPTTERPRGLSK